MLFSAVSRTELMGQGLSEDSQEIDYRTVSLGYDALQKINKFQEFIMS